MHLYDYPASGNCYKARLLLALLGEPYERVPVDIFAGDTLTPEYAALNPARETPVLELEDGTVILQAADLALYEAKNAGKNRCGMYEPRMQALAHDRLLLEMDLAAAIERDELFLVYQPTFDPRTGAIIGAEALVRWQHPDRGLLEASEFIPIAESGSAIGPIGRWVLSEACRQGACWHRQRHAIGLSVNVSGRQLDDDQLLTDVRDAFDASGLDAESLTLEITETALIRDPLATAPRLAALKALGIRIAIDDFGTGYSSLSYLGSLPVDALKIDRSFISGISGATESSALLHALVQLGKTLQLETLGEGIEHHAQLTALKGESCDYGQGFLLARPLTPTRSSPC